MTRMPGYNTSLRKKHPPAFQLGDPQQGRAQPGCQGPGLRFQDRDLLVPRRDDTAQLPHKALHTRLIGHEPQACST